MPPDDENPFNGLSEEDGDDAVWVAVAALVGLFFAALVCWIL